MSSKVADGVANTLELKPCPFCGGKAEMITGNIYCDKCYHYVECTICHSKTTFVIIEYPSINCKGELDESTRYASEQAAKIAADTWNRRA